MMNEKETNTNAKNSVVNHGIIGGSVTNTVYPSSTVSQKDTAISQQDTAQVLRIVLALKDKLPDLNLSTEDQDDLKLANSDTEEQCRKQAPNKAKLKVNINRIINMLHFASANVARNTIATPIINQLTPIYRKLIA